MQESIRYAPIFIIEQTGNITVYGGNSVLIKSGFHAKPGSTFHAFIHGPSECYGGYAKSGTSDSSNDGNENETKMETLLAKSTTNEGLRINLIPNPNSGNFIFEVNQANPKGTLNVYGVDGKLYYEQFVNQTQTRLVISLRNGLYLVVYKTVKEMQTIKLIIN